MRGGTIKGWKEPEGRRVEISRGKKETVGGSEGDFAACQ